MAEVRRVHDRQLGRNVAFKLIHARVGVDPARFAEEARITASLQHPGIVPVHDAGQLADGRSWFTLQEVHGQTLAEVLDWPLRRLIGVFVRVCETVAYAHAQGVLHRDLKPSNLMLGAYGEVFVLDWGLAAALVSDGGPSEIAGTPAYMAPEQARGEVLGVAADIYALGAVLYQILTRHPPYSGATPRDVLRAVLAGPPPPPTGELPPELVALCLAAMARDPGARPGHAEALADAARSWLDGAQRREEALAVVADAEALAPAIEADKAAAAALRERANSMLRGDPSLGDRESAWELQERAAGHEHDAEAADAHRLRLLHAAVSRCPELPEARARLADQYRRLLDDAEATHDRAGTARYEALLAAHDDGRHARHLDGSDAVTLQTDLPATVEIYRYVERKRRLVPEHIRTLPAPLDAPALPRGSYLLVIRGPSSAVRYPVALGRGEHWRAIRAGEPTPTPILIPPQALPDEQVYVPAGWFWAGGDREAAFSVPGRRVWVDGFVIQRFPVSLREYLDFLDALVAVGREEEAWRHAPRERAGTSGASGEATVGRGSDGRFVPLPDADGDLWQLDWPVTLINWEDASAFAAWRSARDGLAWRLPFELEWEKGARGVDGRFYPWGNEFDRSFACTRDAHASRPLPAPIDSFPDDQSPYGVRGMAGNVRTWCQDLFSPSGQAEGGALRAFRGGGWGLESRRARCATRAGDLWSNRLNTLGVRLVRSMG